MLLLLLLSRFSRVRLCDPWDGSPPGSPVPGILKARTLEWVAISFSNAWKWKVKGKSLSRVRPSQPHVLQPTRLFRPWDSPGKSTGVGCHCLLRDIDINKCKCIVLNVIIKAYTHNDSTRQRLNNLIRDKAGFR